MSSSVVHSVPTLKADFWAEVAHKMKDSFTPSDCQTVYNQLSEDRLKPTTTKKQTKGKEKAKSMAHYYYQHLLLLSSLSGSQTVIILHLQSSI